MTHHSGPPPPRLPPDYIEKGFGFSPRHPQQGRDYLHVWITIGMIGTAALLGLLFAIAVSGGF